MCRWRGHGVRIGRCVTSHSTLEKGEVRDSSSSTVIIVTNIFRHRSIYHEILRRSEASAHFLARIISFNFVTMAAMLYVLCSLTRFKISRLSLIQSIILQSQHLAAFYFDAVRSIWCSQYLSSNSWEFLGRFALHICWYQFMQYLLLKVSFLVHKRWEYGAKIYWCWWSLRIDSLLQDILSAWIFWRKKEPSPTTGNQV